jgi:hypothetical protein
MGRFGTPDPSFRNIGLGNSQTWNLYSYVTGDPINSGDPSGLAGVSYVPIPICALFPYMPECRSGGGSGGSEGTFGPEPERGDGENQLGPDTSGGGPDPEIVWQNQLNGALRGAESALGRPDCLKWVFGGAPNSGPNSPYQLLKDMEKSKAITPVFIANAKIDGTIDPDLETDGGG